MIVEILEKTPEEKTFVIPARLDDCQVPSFFGKYQWADLSDEEGFDGF
jgi:hypothetical protein